MYSDDIYDKFINHDSDPISGDVYAIDILRHQLGPGSLMDYLGISNPNCYDSTLPTPKSTLGAGVRFSGLDEHEDPVTADSKMWFFNIFPSSCTD